MVDELIVEQSEKTPEVKYDSVKKCLYLNGLLTPEDPKPFFDKLSAWLGGYRNSNQNDLRIEFYLEYYNSSSLKRLFSFFKELEWLIDMGKEVTVVWKCDKGDLDNIGDGEKMNAALSFEILIETN